MGVAPPSRLGGMEIHLCHISSYSKVRHVTPEPDNPVGGCQTFLELSPNGSQMIGIHLAALEPMTSFVGVADISSDTKGG